MRCFIVVRYQMDIFTICRNNFDEFKYKCENNTSFYKVINRDKINDIIEDNRWGFVNGNIIKFYSGIDFDYINSYDKNWLLFYR
jgi:hypothetical protein